MGISVRGALGALIFSLAIAGYAIAAPVPVPVPKPQAQLVDAAAVRAAQPAMLQEAARDIRPGVPGETELFAVLAAWYPNQRVFLREIDQAAEVLAERFDSRGRVLRLASSLTHPMRHPLATPQNLAAAVEAVAAQMNPGEDVLMVYLTSHGVPGALATGEWPVETPHLLAGELDAILDGVAGENVVAVVSACRSGSFVPVLRDASRLVITAAAADRNSFGCSDANEWTWFGKAFFDQALRETRNLPDAFDRAATLVAEWEERSGEIPSQPQIAEGTRIGPALQALARGAGE